MFVLELTHMCCPLTVVKDGLRHHRVQWEQLPCRQSDGGLEAKPNRVQVKLLLPHLRLGNCSQDTAGGKGGVHNQATQPSGKAPHPVTCRLSVFQDQLRVKLTTSTSCYWDCVYKLKKAFLLKILWRHIRDIVGKKIIMEPGKGVIFTEIKTPNKVVNLQ